MTEFVLSAAVALSLGVWFTLLCFRGGFWRSDRRLVEARADDPMRIWPAVTVVVPARNERALIAETLTALLGQDYAGALAIILIDDGSTDGTAEIAARCARNLGADRLTVLRGEPLESGWTGKLWAMEQGVRYAQTHHPDTGFLLLTDADILHHPGSVRQMVDKVGAEGIDLVSLMVRLDVQGVWGRLLIPAFVFFFQKISPFAWVADPSRKIGAAAGGSMLVRPEALTCAGGLAAIRGALIDDCALGQAIKTHGGRLWLGLTTEVRSVRPYGGMAGIWSMVRRTAYTQLNHSPLNLFGALVGMVITYLVPPLALVAGLLVGDWLAAGLGGAVWVAMAVAFWPTLRLYGQPAAMAALLPVAGLLYSLMTFDSAIQHWRGCGGQWKGRVVRADGGMKAETH